MDDAFLKMLNFKPNIKCLNDAHYLHLAGWIPKKEVHEELPPQPEKLIPSDTEASIVEIKPLPKDLKYAFFLKELFSGHFSAS